METPLVSVVMSVFNGERFLDETLASLLAQSGVSFEIVVVDDGSADGTSRILRRAVAASDRIRVLEQANTGLTRALVRGCAEARGRFIARQDNGDISVPGRLERLAEALEAHPEAAVAASWTETIGPEGEHLEITRYPEGMAASTAGVLEERSNPAHGSVMFRKEDYDAVGGYRPEFHFAQDSDLWMRIADRGGFLFVPEVLYRSRVFGGSISALHREAQIRLYEIAAASRKARAAGRSDAELLAQASSFKPGARPTGRSEAGTGDYFIGRMLLRNRDRRAMRYLGAHLRRRPLDPKGWLALARSCLLSRGNVDASRETP